MVNEWGANKRIGFAANFTADSSERISGWDASLEYIRMESEADHEK